MAIKALRKSIAMLSSPRTMVSAWDRRHVKDKGKDNLTLLSPLSLTPPPLPRMTTGYWPNPFAKEDVPAKVELWFEKDDPAKKREIEA